MRISGGQRLPQQGHGLLQGLLQRDGVILLFDAEGAVVAAVLQRLQERLANSSTPLVSSRVFCPAAGSRRTSLMWTW